MYRKMRINVGERVCLCVCISFSRLYVRTMTVISMMFSFCGHILLFYNIYTCFDCKPYRLTMLMLFFLPFALLLFHIFGNDQFSRAHALSSLLSLSYWLFCSSVMRIYCRLNHFSCAHFSYHLMLQISSIFDSCSKA